MRGLLNSVRLTLLAVLAAVVCGCGSGNARMPAQRVQAPIAPLYPYGSTTVAGTTYPLPPAPPSPGDNYHEAMRP